jgi:hypothetical protein
MTEQHAPALDDFHTWVTGLGPDAYALAWVADEGSPAGWERAEPPSLGKTGIDRPGADLERISVQEVARGQRDTLRRWLQLDDGTRHLAIIGADGDGLREYTPGDLIEPLMRPPAAADEELAELLASWLHKRSAEAPPHQELGWVAAAAAWCYHMGTFSSHPPLPVLSSALARAGELDEDTRTLVISTGWRMADLLEMLERPLRPRAELAEDWATMSSLSLAVPVLKPSADWLLDQLALRDPHAQQLRAVLEPDLTDHLRDLRADGPIPGAAPALDAPRAAHLAQARSTVRAYTAAVYSGHEQEAQHVLDTFPIPIRDLSTSGPAATWRQHSATARDAVEALAAERAATIAEGSTDLFADPELLHATTSYLAAREGQLHLVHDALGRLAFPTPPPRELPEALAPVAAAQTQRRVIEAFGTLERATQALDGQIQYQLQQPAPAHQHATTGTETDLLTRARGALERMVPLDEQHIRARLQEAMARPTAPVGRGPSKPTAHDEAHTQSLGAGSISPGVNR